ncbi:hypothetical protein BHE74_00052548 [Ensete ventricosum]|nr:hypothetical protein BHE74_00052548 [Ensete ventricosum]
MHVDDVGKAGVAAHIPDNVFHAWGRWVRWRSEEEEDDEESSLRTESSKQQRDLCQLCRDELTPLKMLSRNKGSIFHLGEDGVEITKTVVSIREPKHMRPASEGIEGLRILIHHKEQGSNVVTKSSCSLSKGGLGFIKSCFLCKRKLIPSKDVYMYRYSPSSPWETWDSAAKNAVLARFCKRNEENLRWQRGRDCGRLNIVFEPALGYLNQIETVGYLE